MDDHTTKSDNVTVPHAQEPGGTVFTDHGPVPGCPNNNCTHAALAHDIEDVGDPIPMCGSPGCQCGHPADGWQRVIPQKVWQPGDTVTAGDIVMNAHGAIYTPIPGQPLISAVVAVEPVATPA